MEDTEEAVLKAMAAVQKLKDSEDATSETMDRKTEEDPEHSGEVKMTEKETKSNIESLSDLLPVELPLSSTSPDRELIESNEIEDRAISDDSYLEQDRQQPSSNKFKSEKDNVVVEVLR